MGLLALALFGLVGSSIMLGRLQMEGKAVLLEEKCEILVDQRDRLLAERDDLREKLELALA